MIKHEKKEASSLFLENNRDKKTSEYFNELGYNYFQNEKKKIDHFKSYAYTNQKMTKSKVKR